MKLSSLLENIEVMNIAGCPDGEVASLCHDSRNCREGALFVAVPGLEKDGRDYIPDAVKRGAAYIVYEGDLAPPAGITAVKVRSTRRALGILGKNYYGHPSSRLCLAGIMGTNGKTTVTYLLESILGSAGSRVGVLGTVNYRYGDKTLPAPNTTPESVEFQRILREMADGGVSHVIAEVSSHAVDLGRVDDCSFDAGVFTNLSRDHLDYHRTMEDYFQAKLRFFKEILPAGDKKRACKMAINGDDEWGRRIIKETAAPCLTFGMVEEADVRAENVFLSLEGIEADIKSRFGAIHISSPLIGRFNLYNILAAAAAAFILDVPGINVEQGVKDLKYVPGRLERVRSGQGPFVFVDYAHTDDALSGVLGSLSDFKSGRIITVFGCGGNRDRGKRPLMGAAAARFSDITVVTSDNPRREDPMEIIREIERGMDGAKVEKLPSDALHEKREGKIYTVLPDRKQAIDFAIGIAGPADTVLIAGKGHEDYQIIGEKRFPFDDRLIALAALESRPGKGLQD